MTARPGPHPVAQAWHPDARASLGLAAAAGCLVTAGFAALFSAVAPFKLTPPAVSVREVLVLAEPVPARARPVSRIPLPHAVLPVQLPELQRMPLPSPVPLRSPDSISVQGYLDERAKDSATALRDRVMGKDLQRELGKTTEKEALEDDQSYQTTGGQKIVRSGGGCAQIQTVQGSSSPTNHTSIAEPTDCPGGSHDASHEMGKALDDWAKKAQASQPPPPRFY